MDYKTAVLFATLILDLLSCFVQAQQRPRITEHPTDAVAAKEEPLTLNCKATGRPPPDIVWFHNGVPLVPDERKVILPEGSLFFLRVMQNKREQDAGVYWCEARSAAGSVSSRNATLQIAMLRDEFRIVPPKNTVAIVGGPVILPCSPPRGIPEPSVLWSKDGKSLDLGGKRLSLVDSGSLMISEVQASDAGSYECSAQSMAGSRTAPPAMLKVLAPPTVIRGPHDTEVIEGEGFDLPCELAGDPVPTVSWHREIGNLPEGRSRVLLDNTLRIEDARPEDQGQYICKGQNEGGNVSITVMLHVYAVPTFVEAPADVTAKEGETVKMPCRAQGRPRVRVVWDRVGRFTHEEPKISFSTRNDLLSNTKMSPLRTKRNGNNETTATPTTNVTTTMAANEENHDDARTKREINGLHIVNLHEEQFDDESVRHKRVPTRDAISLLDEFDQIMRDKSDNFSADDDADAGNTAAAMAGKTFRRRRTEEEIQEIMRASAAKRAKRDISVSGVSDPSNVHFSTPSTISNYLEINENGDLLLRDVTHNDQGWYACAALNEAGSIVKKVFVRVMSKDETDDEEMDMASIPEPQGSRWGSALNIMITAVVSTSYNSLDVYWETSENLHTGPVTLYYRPVPAVLPNVNNVSPRGAYKSQAAALDTKEHTLNDLKPYTEYEIFVAAPKGLGGMVSNIRKRRTMPSAPSAPPTDIKVGIINTTAAFVRWSPPPSHLLNGELTGYKIQIKSNATNKLLGQMSLNATTQSVVINSLSPGGRYIARVAGGTAGGYGPYSPPAALHMDPSFIIRPATSDPNSGFWTAGWLSFIALGALGAILLGGAVFAIVWARKNKRNMKASYPGVTGVTGTMIPDKQHTLWLHGNSLVKPTHSLAQISEYAELTNHQNGTAKILNNSHPEPYATVTLQRGGQTSDDSCVKCSQSPSSSEYNAPLREPLNLQDMLPPPPDHPYGSYMPINTTNMTIRHNPLNPNPISPQVGRRMPPHPPRWVPNSMHNTSQTMHHNHASMHHPPPIPNFPQNWMQQQRLNAGLDINPPEVYSENDYESGSVLYEQCYRPDPNPEFFNRGGEPTEEFYRNVNMEFYGDYYDEEHPASPPGPAPSDYPSNNSNLRLLGGNQDSPVNSRKQSRSTASTQSAQSSDTESDDDAGGAADHRWTSRPGRRSRSRSKSNDRKYRTNR